MQNLIGIRVQGVGCRVKSLGRRAEGVGSRDVNAEPDWIWVRDVFCEPDEDVGHPHGQIIGVGSDKGRKPKHLLED